MAKKDNYSYKTRRVDTLTNRMMIVFVLLVVSVYGLLYIRNWLGTNAALSYYDIYLKVVKWIPIIPLVLTAAAALFFVKSKKSGKDERIKTFSSSFALSICAVLLVITLLISRNVYTGYIPSVVFVVLVSLLYFIAVSFPGSYLVMTVFNAFAAFAIYALHLVSPIDNPISHYVLRTLVIAVTAFLAFALVKAKKNGGAFGPFKILNPRSDYLPLFIALAVFALFIILGMLNIGSYILFDVIIALETIIFALFYAIKTLK